MQSSRIVLNTMSILYSNLH
uniref:Uncharacterized protein n=1 Tax=Arundo donax TaxID=35708 RepID=A0A0A9AAC6_ARUDO